jgi:aspartyl-tRNA synthetase
MSFVDEDDIIETTEQTMARVFEAVGFSVAPPPWPRLPFSEAMLRYGSDKPDLRFGLEIADLGEEFALTEFKVFSRALSTAGGVSAGSTRGARELPRRELDELTEVARRFGAGGLVWAFVQEDGTWRSPAAKALTDGERAAVGRRLGASRVICCCSWPTRRMSPRPRWVRSASSSRAASGSSRTAAMRSAGSSTSRCSSARTRVGRRCTTRSRRRSAPSPIPGP